MQRGPFVEEEMPKKKTLKKVAKKMRGMKKETDLETSDDDELGDEFEGDVGEEVDEVGAEPVAGKDDEF